MTTKVLRLIAGLALAVAFFAAPNAASAAPTTRTLDATFCWSLTSFGPGGCNSNWPADAITLIGSKTQGAAYYQYGTPYQVAGAYQFSSNGANLTLTFLNPEPGVASAVYTGARYSGGGKNCYRGTMRSDLVPDPDATGVWFGCVRN